jgi:hypothetical protein
VLSDRALECKMQKSVKPNQVKVHKLFRKDSETSRAKSLEYVPRIVTSREGQHIWRSIWLQYHSDGAEVQKDGGVLLEAEFEVRT